MKPKVNVMLDSGAFSANTRGEIIDRVKFADFVIANRQHLEVVVNLDVIPKGSAEDAASEGWDNYVYLTGRGLDILPVFHMGEHTRWLDKMLEAKCPWIGLGGTVESSTQERMRWYDLIWPYITDSSGYPVANFHSFGNTSPIELLQYPWYSADSTTWCYGAGRFGNIIIGNRAYAFQSKTAKSGKKFIDESDPEAKRAVWEESFRRWNFNYELLARSEVKDDEMNVVRSYLACCHFLDLQEQTRSIQGINKTVSLIDVCKYGPGVPQVDPLRLFFAVSRSGAIYYLVPLTALGINNILLSYFYITKRSWEEESIPWLYNPVEFCQKHPKLARFWDTLQKFLLNPVEQR